MNKKTWLITYLNDASEVVTGDRMGAHTPMCAGESSTYHFWDDELSPNGPFMVVNAAVVSSIRLQPMQTHK